MNEFMKRVGIPLMIPVLSLAVIVVVVINLSRIFIGLEENNGPRWVVVFATVLGLALFAGFIYYASSQAPKVGNSAVLASGGIVVVLIGFAGAEIIQAKENAHQAEEEGEALGPPAVTIVAVDNDFPETSFTIGQGEVIGYENQGTAVHTLVAEGAPGFAKLTISGEGATAAGVVDLEPGEYAFFCDIAGHRASGMEATVTVTEGGGGGAGAAAGGGGGGGGGVVITSTQEIAFEPTEVTAAPGAKLTLKNQGALIHTLVLEGVPAFAKLEVTADGDEATGTVPAEPGEYVFFCDIAGHRQVGMEGTLTVG